MSSLCLHLYRNLEAELHLMHDDGEPRSFTKVEEHVA